MTDAVTIAIIGNTATLATAIYAAWKSGKNGKKISEVHLQINSRMDQLLKISGAAEKAKGVIEGANDNQAKTDAKQQKDK